MKNSLGPLSLSLALYLMFMLHLLSVLRTAQEVNTYLYNTESEAVYDFGDLLLMPGLIDTNVHISEPGRTDWEGFVSATKAAAAGGFTTIINRPT